MKALFRELLKLLLVLAALGLLLYAAGTLAMAMIHSMVFHTQYESPLGFPLVVVEFGSLILASVSYAAYCKLYNDDSAPNQFELGTFLRMASIIWMRFMTDGKSKGRIGEVSSRVSVDENCVYVNIEGDIQVRWWRSPEGVDAIHLPTGSTVFISRQVLRKAYKVLEELFDLIARYRW